MPGTTLQTLALFAAAAAVAGALLALPAPGAALDTGTRAIAMTS